MSAALELRGLEVVYADTTAVSGLDLVLGPGAWLGIVGPNGAGKSSVLRAVAGLVHCSGTILIGGLDAARMRPRDRARRVALVAQRAVVPPVMRVSDYVLLGRTPYVSDFGTETHEDRRVAASTLEDLGMGRFAGRTLDSLSGGELQRAVLARALAQRAPLLLLDEPTTFLDVGHQQDVLELVDALRLRDGLTVVSVMHDLTLAAQFAEELLLLSGGRAVASGPAHEVLTEASIREHYGASVRVLRDGPSGGVAVLPHRGRSRPEGNDAAAEELPTPPTERPRREGPRVRTESVVVVHTGDGKGKTTAAVGTALRAVARGWQVCVVQFIKSGRWRSGEQVLGTRAGIEWHAMGDGFTWDSDDLERSRELAAAAWDAAKARIASGEYGLVVLDEITYPMTWGWIDTTDVVESIRARPRHVNVVATGRDAPAALVEVADTVSEMTNVKHAYDRGIPALRGIDF